VLKVKSPTSGAYRLAVLVRVKSNWARAKLTRNYNAPLIERRGSHVARAPRRLERLVSNSITPAGREFRKSRKASAKLLCTWAVKLNRIHGLGHAQMQGQITTRRLFRVCQISKAGSRSSPEAFKLRFPSKSESMRPSGLVVTSCPNVLAKLLFENGSRPIPAMMGYGDKETGSGEA
jgi:hypothetical protein